VDRSTHIASYLLEVERPHAGKDHVCAIDAV
jgi:hypothetical protein